MLAPETFAFLDHPVQNKKMFEILEIQSTKLLKIAISSIVIYVLPEGQIEFDL